MRPSSYKYKNKRKLRDLQLSLINPPGKVVWIFYYKTIISRHEYKIWAGINRGEDRIRSKGQFS